MTAIHYNPFSLTTARQGWENEPQGWVGRTFAPHPGKDIAQKIFYSGSGALYDLYVKNPYDMTFGNIYRVFINPRQNYSKLQKASALSVAFMGTLYSLMLYGVSLHIAGSVIGAAGNRTGLRLVSQGGKFVKLAGEKIFLAGSVPAYSLFYALPKKIIEELPRLAKMIFDKVLVPFWKNILKPALDSCVETCRWLFSKLSSSLRFLAEKISNAAQWIFQNVFTPLWKNVLSPIVEVAMKGLRWVFTKIGNTLQLLCEKISAATQWVFNKIIAPLARQCLKGMQWVFNKILVPLWKNILSPALEALARLAHIAFLKISETLSFLVNKTVDLARVIFDYTLVPLWKAFSFLAGKTKEIAVWLFTHVISPSLAFLWKGISSVGTFVFSTVSIAAQKILALSQAIFRTILQPLFSALGELASTIKDQVVNELASLQASAVEAWEKTNRFFSSFQRTA